jgi:hypothetical protein
MIFSLSLSLSHTRTRVPPSRCLPPPPSQIPSLCTPPFSIHLCSAKLEIVWRNLTQRDRATWCSTYPHTRYLVESPSVLVMYPEDTNSPNTDCQVDRNSSS